MVIRNGNLFRNVPANAERAADAGPSYECDVYFALGGFTNGALTNTKGRTTANVVALRALWIDVDVKDFAHDRVLMAETVKTFIETNRLPPPARVWSGGGIHLYWPLDADVTELAVWDGMAKALRSMWIAHNHGRKVDVTRIADKASILRLPGTSNFKYDPPAPITILDMGGPPSSVEYITTLLKDCAPPSHAARAVAPSDVFGTPPAHAIGGTPKGFHVEPERPKRYFPIVLEKCSQMRWARDNPAQVTEPVWRQVLSVAGMCEDGRAVAHEISKGHPNYSEAETDDKLERVVLRDAPARCEWFRINSPTGCVDCTAQVASPLLLGTEVETPAAQGTTRDPSITEVVGDDGVFTAELRPVNARYMLNEEGTFERNADGKPPLMLIANLHMVGIDRYKYGGKYYARYAVRKSQLIPGEPNPWSELRVPMSDLVDERAVAKHIADTSGAAVAFPGRVVAYMRSFLEQLNHYSDRTAPAEMGWQENASSGTPTGFAFGTRLLSVDGRESLIPTTPAEAASAFRATGDESKWLKAYEQYTGTGMAAHGFVTLAAFAAPLIRHAGISGVILALQGETGAGKTSTMRFAASVNANPYHPAYWRGQNSTAMAHYAYLGKLRHNLGLLDDLIGIDQEELPELIYNIANGAGRSRLTSDGAAKAVHTWQTIMLLSTNTDIKGILRSMPSQYVAAQKRVITVNLSKPDGFKASAGSAMEELLTANHGHAGLTYMKYVVMNLTWVVKQLRAKMSQLETAWGAPSEDRFVVATMACMLVGGEIAKKVGVCPLDMDMMEFVAREIYHGRTPQPPRSETAVAEGVMPHLNGKRRQGAATLLSDIIYGCGDRLETYDAAGKLSVFGAVRGVPMGYRTEQDGKPVVFVGENALLKALAAKHISMEIFTHVVTSEGLLLSEGIVTGKGARRGMLFSDVTRSE